MVTDSVPHRRLAGPIDMVAQFLLILVKSRTDLNFKMSFKLSMKLTLKLLSRLSVCTGFYLYWVLSVLGSICTGFYLYWVLSVLGSAHASFNSFQSIAVEIVSYHCLRIAIS